MSDLLNSASLVMIPSGYKEDIVYSEVPTNGNGDLSFTRASNGTRVNSSGLVEVCPWNLAEQSNTFSNAIWGLSDATVTGSQSGYDGTNNAWKLQSSGGTGTYIVQGSFSTIRTQSIYAKAGTTSKFSIIVGGYGNGMQFDLSNGTIVTNSNSSYFSGSITSVGNGWYYIVVTIQAIAPTYGYLVAPQNLGGGGISVGDYVFIQNSQVNLGTAKPYFPTTDRLNVPRLTYQNGGGGCPSLLLEKQSTNLLSYSQDFSNAFWNKTNVGIGDVAVITPNYAISPDGTQNASRLVCNLNGGTTASARSWMLANFTAQATSTLSIWIKLNSAGTKTIIFSESGGDTKTISGTDWQRIDTSFVGANGEFRIGLIGGSTSDTLDCCIWGAQAESGSYPTSYIPTTSSSATRVADAIANQTTSIAQAFTDNTKGTIFFDLKNIKFGTSAAARFRFGNSSSALQFAIYLDSIGVGVYAYQGTGYVINTNLATSQKLAIRFDGTSITGFSQGVQRNTVTAGSSFNIDQMTDNNTENFCFEINQFVLFNSVLTNAECIALTTI